MESDSIQDLSTGIELAPPDNKYSYYTPDYVEIITRDISTRIGLALVWFIRCKSLEDDSFGCQSFSDQTTFARNYAIYITVMSQDTIGLMNSMLFLPRLLEMPKCSTQFSWADWSTLLGDDRTEIWRPLFNGDLFYEDVYKATASSPTFTVHNNQWMSDSLHKFINITQLRRHENVGDKPIEFENPIADDNFHPSITESHDAVIEKYFVYNVMDLSVSSDEDIDNASDVEVVENHPREQLKEIIDRTMDEQNESSIEDSSPDIESHPPKKISPFQIRHTDHIEHELRIVRRNSDSAISVISFRS
eukprot:scaffold1218_cov175-Alexandrium_tamarense.AAC.3